MITELTLRPPTLDDAVPLAEMLNAASLADFGVAMHDADENLSEWQSPGRDIAHDALMAVRPDGQIVAYVEVEAPAPPVRIDVWGRVHPDWRSGDTGLRLWQWAEQVARRKSAAAPDGARVIMFSETSSSDEAGQAMFRAAGMALARHYWRMAIELDEEPPTPQWPEGIHVRHIAPGEEPAVFRAVDAAFRDQWGHVERPFDDAFARWAHFKMDPSYFDPTLWFVAVDAGHAPGAEGAYLRDGAIAGMAVNRAWLPEDAKSGWVSHLGVLRPWRRKGIALALLLHTFRAMRARGCERVGLGVDATSLTGATRLYEKAGMHVQFAHVLYEKVLREGRDLTTQAADK